MNSVQSAPSLLQLLALSFIAALTGSIVEQGIRWSNVFEGIFNAIVHSPLTAISWSLFGLLPGLLAWRLLRKSRFERLKRLLTVFPGFALGLQPLIGVLVDLPFQSSNFRHATGVELPSTAKNVKAVFSGGGVADYWYTFYFECDPDTVEKLVDRLNLEPTDNRSDRLMDRRSSDVPDSKEWIGRNTYRGERDGGAWFWYLVTDSSKSKVFFVAGTI